MAHPLHLFFKADWLPPNKSMQTAGRVRLKGSVELVCVDGTCNVYMPVRIFESRPQLMDDSVSRTRSFGEANGKAHV